jgi:hypothetical protein
VRDASVTTREGDVKRALTCVGGRRRVQGRRVLRRKEVKSGRVEEEGGSEP